MSPRNKLKLTTYTKYTISIESWLITLTTLQAQELTLADARIPLTINLFFQQQQNG